MATKDIDPLTTDETGADVTANLKSMETSAQQWVESCGVCHVGGGSLEYDRDLNWYGSATTGSGDAYLLKYAKLDDTSFVTVSAGYMSSSNKAEMDCLMCHLDGSNPGAAWLRTLGCDTDTPVGPYYDPTCLGAAGGRHATGARTINTDMEDGVGEYDMFNRNFALKQYKPMFAPSMGAGAKGVFTGTELTGVDWGTAGAVTLPGSRITDTPKSENCSVCHARYDDTMGLPGMMAMKTGFGNFDLLYRPDAVGNGDVPAGLGGVYQDLDTDNGATAANDDFFQDFGCKTGMGKRAHKVNADGDYIGANARYGMTPMLPSTMDADAGTTPNIGDPIVGKMPDIDVHNSAGMQCATCHYALGSNQVEGYLDIPARTAHGSDYPAERVYGMDHQFAQADSFPDVKGKENLDNTMNCESCHMDQTHPNKGTAVIPTHAGFPQSHMDKIGCATCHIPETYAAPGRLKYRDYSAGFWHHAQKNVLDWNYDLMTGSHNTVPSLHRWLDKSANGGPVGAKIYPVLPSIMPTWFMTVTNANVVRDDGAIVCVEDDGVNAGDIIPGADLTGLDATDVGAACTGNLVDGADLAVGTATGLVALFSSEDGGPADTTYVASTAFTSPIKSRDAALVADYVRDNGGLDSSGNFVAGKGDGYCGPAWTCVGGVNAGAGCSDRTDCTKFDIRVNGANTFPLFDGFQLADGWEIDTKVEVDAMLKAFAANANGSDAANTKFLALVQVDFDVTHGIVPKEWALGGSQRGGCVSCHSSKDPASDNYNANSVGFFEGYVQPIDKAGMMVGAYDIVKNWTAMFADFDCTQFCGMGQVAESALFDGTGKFISGATCGSGSMFATIDQCVDLMTSTFDKAMGFPSGTAMQMGMYDGIAGLQGFTVNTLQTIGYLKCNPFGGVVSQDSPAGNVNACMPAPTESASFDAMGMNAGTCVANACSAGFRQGGACYTDADCKGAMTDDKEVAHSPMGLILSRKEVRSRQKIDLQQGYTDNDPANGNHIKWSMSLTKNPGNAAHMNAWDQASFCIDRNSALYPNPFAPGAVGCANIPYTYAECTAGAMAFAGGSGNGKYADGVQLTGTPMQANMTPATGPGNFAFCSSAQSPDGQRHIMHMMQANQLLGYTPTKLAELMVPMEASTYRAAVHRQHAENPIAMNCSDCHYNGSLSDTNVTGALSTDYAVVCDPSPGKTLFTYTASPGTNSGTCTTTCHDAVADGTAPAKAKARISDRNLVTDVGAANFQVELDGTPSACYAVDLMTGQVTQGTKTYTWSFPATLTDGTTASAAPTANTCAGNTAKCIATWAAGGLRAVKLDVACSAGGVSDYSIVDVNPFDIGKGPNASPGLTASVSGTVVTVTAPTLDDKVGDIQITWGDYTKSTITGELTIDDFVANGIDHNYGQTYAGGKTYSVKVVTTNNSGNKNQYTYPLNVYIAP